MKRQQSFDAKHLETVQRFCDQHRDKLRLWGEYAVPQFLAWSFFRRMCDASDSTDHLYGTLVEALATRNAPNSDDALSNAYYDVEAIMPHVFGLSHRPLEESFAGKSNYLEALLHLFVRANLRQRAKLIFPPVTRIAFREFKPEHHWQWFCYLNLERGIDVERFLVPPHSWKALREIAAESAGSDLSERLRYYPLHYLAMILVMPHRGTSSGIRWLASRIDEMAADKTWLEA